MSAILKEVTCLVFPVRGGTDDLSEFVDGVKLVPKNFA